MRLTALLPPLLTDPTTAELVAAAGSRARTDRSVVVAPGARPAVLALMAMGPDGVARAVEPTHTSVDGDALFCLATGEVEASVDRVALLAARAVAAATRRGPISAVGLDIPEGPMSGHLPGHADRT